MRQNKKNILNGALKKELICRQPYPFKQYLRITYRLRKAEKETEKESSKNRRMKKRKRHEKTGPARRLRENSFPPQDGLASPAPLFLRNQRFSKQDYFPTPFSLNATTEK